MKETIFLTSLMLISIPSFAASSCDMFNTSANKKAYTYKNNASAVVSGHSTEFVYLYSAPNSTCKLHSFIVPGAKVKVDKEFNNNGKKWVHIIREPDVNIAPVHTHGWVDISKVNILK